jgi:hypothetical protein
MHTYVPITPGYVPNVSQRAQELGAKIGQVIQEYEQTHPGMSPLEVQQAIKLAGSGTGNSRARILVALMLGLSVAALLGGMFFYQMMS